jgi:hypothetical protein
LDKSAPEQRKVTCRLVSATDANGGKRRSLKKWSAGCGIQEGVLIFSRFPDEHALGAGSKLAKRLQCVEN